MQKASETIYNILKENHGSIIVKTLRGKSHIFTLSSDETYIESQTALRSQKLDLNCFDIVMEFLLEKGGKALKGGGRDKESKVGQGKCTQDTVCGCIAMNYYGNIEGESTFDPVFAVSAILEYAGICNNKYGWLEIKCY